MDAIFQGRHHIIPDYTCFGQNWIIKNCQAIAINGVGWGDKDAKAPKKEKKKNTQDKKSNKTKAQQVGALEYCGQQLLLWGAEHLGPRSKDTGMQTEVTAGIE